MKWDGDSSTSRGVDSGLDCSSSRCPKIRRTWGSREQPFRDDSIYRLLEVFVYPEIRGARPDRRGAYGSPRRVRVQGMYVQDNEIARITEYWRSHPTTYLLPAGLETWGSNTMALSRSCIDRLCSPRLRYLSPRQKHAFVYSGTSSATLEQPAIASLHSSIADRAGVGQ